MKEKLLLIAKFNKWFIIAIVVFMWGETIFFLIRDGWHFVPTDPIEIICDDIVRKAFNVWLICYFAYFPIMFICIFYEVYQERKNNEEN